MKDCPISDISLLSRIRSVLMLYRTFYFSIMWYLNVLQFISRSSDSQFLGKIPEEWKFDMWEPKKLVIRIFDTINSAELRFRKLFAIPRNWWLLFLRNWGFLYSKTYFPKSLASDYFYDVRIDKNYRYKNSLILNSDRWLAVQP